MKLKPTKHFSRTPGRNRGFMMVDLFVGMAILAIAILPLAFSYVKESRMLRAEYFHGVAMEIVDGEMEVLAAGVWKDFPEGTQTYVVRAGAAKSLPPGRFEFTRAGRHLRLEWTPERHEGIGSVAREVTAR